MMLLYVSLFTNVSPATTVPTVTNVIITTDDWIRVLILIGTSFPEASTYS